MRVKIIPMDSRIFPQQNSSFRINLYHHKRPITDLLFNRDGDLLFTASKDSEIFLCNLEGGVIGIYEGHEGSVNTISASSDSKLLSSGSSDRKFILWDVESGKKRETFLFKSSVKHVFFYPSSEKIILACDDSYLQKPVISMYDSRSNSIAYEYFPDSVPTSAIVDFSEERIVYSDTKGNLVLLDHRMGKKLLQIQCHSSRINKLRPSWCCSFFITASSDSQSKIIDFENLTQKKLFVAEEPLNDAVIFGNNDKIVCAGGVNARDVTLTRGKKDFDVCFYDIVTQKYIGCFSPHFGTINAIDIHPSSEVFCSGGEDAVVCLMKFEEDFYNAPFTVF